MNRLQRAAMDAGVSLWTVIASLDDYPTGITSGAVRKLGDFRRLTEGFVELNLRGDNAFAAAEQIITRSGLLAMYVSDRTPESIAKRENLEELLNAVREFVEERLEEGSVEISLADFLGMASLATDQDITTPTCRRRSVSRS